MTDRYAVFGNPIEHSKSPLIHSLFANQTKQDMTYDKQEVSLDGFAAAAKKFFDDGGKGLNITVPFKLEAYAFADELSPRAKLAGAVNTLKKKSEENFYGDNTDGCGLVRDITRNLGWEINGKHILILGAGGAVRGVLGPLLDQKPARIFIANRTVEKAWELARLFNMQTISGGGYDSVDCDSFDLIINGSSASLTDDLPPLNSNSLPEGLRCYDMMYRKQPTVFMAWATQSGCRQVSDGLGMLVEQAAESFYLWRGVKPETEAVIKEVRRSL
jgi:shikimate dehydrogenase